MVLAIQFGVPGEQGKQFSRAFDDLGKGIKDLREPFDKIGKDLRLGMRKQFKSEGTHRGTGWRELSPGYAKRKRKRYPGKPILEATGKMRTALLNDKHPSNLNAVRPLWAAFGIQSRELLQRATWHQLGTRNMPKRKIIALEETDRRKWGRIIQTYLLKTVTAAERVAQRDRVQAGG